MLKTRQPLVKKEAYFDFLFPTDFFFYLSEVDYSASFSLTCEIELIFGKSFPYWKIPGLEYPSKTEVPCINSQECYGKPDLGKNIADSFDNISNKIDDTFEYFCNMEGARGGTERRKKLF